MKRQFLLVLRYFPLLFLGCVFNLVPPRFSDLRAQTKDPERILHSLENLQFDVERGLIAKELTLRRDAVTITFERGRMIFLKPVEGVVTGLYFWGNGTIVAIPPNKIEKQQLHLFTGAPILNEHFQEAFIRFTDDTYAQLMDQSQEHTETNESELKFALEDTLDGTMKTSALTNYRILADLMNGRKAPVFSAKILGRKLGTFDFTYDQRKTEDVNLGQFHQTGNRLSYDHWCSFSSKNASEESKETSRREVVASSLRGKLIDARSYKIETQIDKNDKITGCTEIEFVSEQEGEWLLTFDLSRHLKVSQVVDENQQSLLFFQNRDLHSDEEISKLGHDSILVLLNEPLSLGQTKSLKLTYSGDVISRAGSGIFYVGSRGSWYPNVGSTDRAKYTVKFHYPKAFTIVATGDLVKEWEEAQQKHSLWTSDIEIPVAGFNYGDYVKKTAKANTVPIEVYANRGIENVYMEVMVRVEHLRELSRQRQLTPRRRGEIIPEPVMITPNFSDFDTTRFSEEIANQVARTLLFFEPIMGKFPYNKLAVSQIPGRFSQGWPSLLYASSLTFLSSAQRARLGLEADRDAHYLECLHAHEIAHQWWGNQIGWKSYHDLWMIEGFSNYFGYLSMTTRYPTGKQFRDLMRRAKGRLLAKNDEGQTHESAGPIWLGGRLSSSKFPGGYSTVIYEKGAWILHMLRYLMSDPQTGSDQKFQTLIRDFLTAFGGKLASSEDFKRMIEKHMNKDLDLEGNKKMDWFFDQWVYDTGIPTYRLDYSVTALKQGGFLLKGKIKQENVSEFFIMPVEVFGHFSPDKVERIGRVVVSGNEAQFRFSLRTKPLKVTLDENDEILCENKTL